MCCTTVNSISSSRSSRDFSLVQISGAHPASHPADRVCLPRRVKSPEPEASDLLPLSAQARSVWSYTSHPPYAHIATCPVGHTWKTATLPWLVQSQTEAVACRWYAACCHHWHTVVTINNLTCPWGKCSSGSLFPCWQSVRKVSVTSGWSRGVQSINPQSKCFPLECCGSVEISTDCRPDW